jgi:hypothetical protein
MNWIIALVAGAAVALGGVWVSGAVRPDLPGPCAALPAEPRGERRDDGGVLRAAWAALTDPAASVLGDLDGSRFVAARSCVLYAGVLDGTGAPTVVIAETTVSGYSTLLRIAEVRLPAGSGGAAQLAVAGLPVAAGSELDAGVLLPLSGAYLAPARDVVEIVGVGVLHGDGTVEQLPRLGDGVYAPGIAPDRTLAPADRIRDTGAVLILHRDEPYGDRAVALPAVGGILGAAGTPRRAFVVSVGGRKTAGASDAPALTALAAALPALAADPAFPRLLDRWPPHPELALAAGPAGLTLAAGDPGAGLPAFTVPG